jgi:hypothetical protein
MGRDQEETPDDISAGRRILGGFAGTIVGVVVCLIANIVLYNLTNGALDIGWKRSIVLGLSGGFLLGLAFPRVTIVFYEIVSFFIPS